MQDMAPTSTPDGHPGTPSDTVAVGASLGFSVGLAVSKNRHYQPYRCWWPEHVAQQSWTPLKLFREPPRATHLRTEVVVGAGHSQQLRFGDGSKAGE